MYAISYLNNYNKSDTQKETQIRFQLKHNNNKYDIQSIHFRHSWQTDISRKDKTSSRINISQSLTDSSNLKSE